MKSQVKADIEDDEDGLGEWGRPSGVGFAEYFPCVAGSSQSESSDFAIFFELPCTNLHTSFEYDLFCSMFNTQFHINRA